MTLHEIIKTMQEQEYRITMFINDKDRDQLPKKQWINLKAKFNWCRTLVAIAKRRIKTLEQQPVERDKPWSL